MLLHASAWMTDLVPFRPAEFDCFLCLNSGRKVTIPRTGECVSQCTSPSKSALRLLVSNQSSEMFHVPVFFTYTDNGSNPRSAKSCSGTRYVFPTTAAAVTFCSRQHRLLIMLGHLPVCFENRAAFYKPVQVAKKSFHLNAASQWV